MNQIEKLVPEEFLRQAKSMPVVDVRSPSEFRQGHIPGADNIPLFDDEERAKVGTTYTKIGHDEAVRKGLELVGHKLTDFLDQARDAGVRKGVLVHCWRGGMRSEAMAWLFGFSGISTAIMEGGYKAYRKYIRVSFEKGPSLRILGGMTGSGKTEVLREMALQGARVIDLEELACHKGSAFGSLGQGEQPTTEQFENELARHWMGFAGNEPVWVEDESLNIGKVVIPEPFFEKMKHSPVYFLETSFEWRLDRLERDYGAYETGELSEIIRKIGRRMGGDQAKNAIYSLDSGGLRQAISIVLGYYDKTYRHSLQQHDQVIQHVPSNDFAGIKELAAFLKTIR